MNRLKILSFLLPSLLIASSSCAGPTLPDDHINIGNVYTYSTRHGILFCIDAKGTWPHNMDCVLAVGPPMKCNVDSNLKSVKCDEDLQEAPMKRKWWMPKEDNPERLI